MWAGFNLMAHLPTWKALPSTTSRELIERNAVKYVRQQRQEQGNLNQSLREDFSNRGLIFNDVDQAAFRARTTRCLWQVERKARKELLDAAGSKCRQAGLSTNPQEGRHTPVFVRERESERAAIPARASIERLIEALVVRAPLAGASFSR